MSISNRILKRHDCMGSLLSSFIYGLLTRLPWLCKTQNSWSISAAFLPPAAILGMIQSAGVDMSRPFSAPGSFSDSGFPPPRLSSNPGQVIRPGLFTSTGNEHRVSCFHTSYVCYRLRNPTSFCNKTKSTFQIQIIMLGDPVSYGLEF